MKEKTKTKIWFFVWMAFSIIGVELFTFYEDALAYIFTAVGWFYFGYFSNKLASLVIN